MITVRINLGLSFSDRCHYCCTFPGRCSLWRGSELFKQWSWYSGCSKVVTPRITKLSLLTQCISTQLRVYAFVALMALEREIQWTYMCTVSLLGMKGLCFICFKGWLHGREVLRNTTLCCHSLGEWPTHCDVNNSEHFWVFKMSQWKKFCSVKIVKIEVIRKIAAVRHDLFLFTSLGYEF